MKILHFADLHLDARFAWAPREVARRRRRALHDTLSRIVALAREEQVDAVFCGGDLYEHDHGSPDTAEMLRGKLAELAPTRVFLAPGNHDFYAPDSIYRLVRWSENVHVFRDPALVPVELAPGLTLWGAAHDRPAGTPNLLASFRVDRGGIHLGLFHGSERGWLARQGSDKQPHAPFEEPQIEQAGLHHAFLGHYHCSREAERFTYPGNPDPLSFGEEGGPRGAVVATIGADGSVARVWHEVACSAIHDLEVDVTGAGSADEIRQRLRAALEGRTGTARVTLRGELAAHVHLELDDLADAAPHMEHLIPRAGELTIAYELDRVRGEQTVRGEFVRQVEAAGLADDERRRVLLAGLRALDGRDDLEVL